MSSKAICSQDDDRGAELDPLCPAGIIGEQLGGCRRHRVAGEMVFERENRVEAERLGQIAERQVLADDRGVRAAGLTQHVERDPDFHRRTPGLLPSPRRSGRRTETTIRPW
jgi:hypothetical protein